MLYLATTLWYAAFPLRVLGAAIGVFFLSLACAVSFVGNAAFQGPDIATMEVGGFKHCFKELFKIMRIRP